MVKVQVKRRWSDHDKAVFTSCLGYFLHNKVMPTAATLKFAVLKLQDTWTLVQIRTPFHNVLTGKQIV